MDAMFAVRKLLYVLGISLLVSSCGVISPRDADHVALVADFSVESTQEKSSARVEGIVGEVEIIAVNGVYLRPYVEENREFSALGGQVHISGICKIHGKTLYKNEAVDVERKVDVTLTANADTHYYLYADMKNNYADCSIGYAEKD